MRTTVDTSEPAWNIPRTKYLLKDPRWQHWLDQQPLTVRCAHCHQHASGTTGELRNWHREHHCTRT